MTYVHLDYINLTEISLSRCASLQIIQDGLPNFSKIQPGIMVE